MTSNFNFLLNPLLCKNPILNETSDLDDLKTKMVLSTSPIKCLGLDQLKASSNFGGHPYY